jgi:hypothetical protein
MAGDLDRHFHNKIDVALRWATWAPSNGRSPHTEMTTQPNGFCDWDEPTCFPDRAGRDALAPRHGGEPGPRSKVDLGSVPKPRGPIGFVF